MLEESVGHYLRQHPEGVTSKMIHVEMVVESPNPAGPWKDNLLWGVMSRLRVGWKPADKAFDGKLSELLQELNSAIAA
jgi:hypothetical protein